MADLQRELNRIAGTTGLDEAAAASRYAGLTTVTDTVDALNRKAGTRGLDLAAVLSKLAGLAHPIDATAAAALIGTGGGSFTPSNLTNILDWGISDDAASFDVVSGKVSTWRGQLAQITLTQSTAAKRYVTGATTLGGLNTFDSLGANNTYMDSGSFSMSQPITFWFVGKPNGIANNYLFRSLGGAFEMLCGFNAGSGGTTTQLALYAGNDLKPEWAPVGTLNDAFYASMTYNGASSTAVYNGDDTPTVGSNPGNVGAQNFSAGFRLTHYDGTSTGYPFPGQVAMWGFQQGVPSSNDRAGMAAWVARYGL